MSTEPKEGLKHTRQAHVLENAAVISQNPGNSWLFLLFLTVTNSLMNLDRTLLQLLADPIQREFRLTDGQLGILIGLAFSVPYGVASILLGPVIDRVNRKRYLAIILATWSGVTFATGLVANYAFLLLTRSALGASEATAGPTAMSMLGDLFPPKWRSTTIGIFKIGTPIGFLIASLIVGYVAADHGWRTAFFIAGVPGLLVAGMLFFLFLEPVRGAMDGGLSGDEPTSYLDAFRFVLGTSVILAFTAAYLFSFFANSAFLAFSAPFLQRYHDFSLGDIGFYFGIASVFGIVTPVLAGILADRLSFGGIHRIVWLLGLITAVLLGLSMVIIYSPSAGIVGFAFLLWQFLVTGFATPCMGLLISLTPTGMRGSVLSLMGVAGMCIGFGLGPMVVGLASDYLGGSQSLRYALALVVGLGGLASVAMFWFTAIALRRKPAGVL